MFCELRQLTKLFNRLLDFKGNPMPKLELQTGCDCFKVYKDLEQLISLDRVGIKMCVCVCLVLLLLERVCM